MKALFEKTEALTPEQLLNLEKFYVGDFYRLDGVTAEDATFDQNGQTRTQIHNLEMVLRSEVASGRTAKPVTK